LFDVATGRFTTIYKKNPSFGVTANGISKSKPVHGIVDESADVAPSHEVTFDIGLNGDIAIASQDLFDSSRQSEGKDTTAGDIKMEEDSSSQEKMKTIAKSLDITGDLDIWISWLSEWAHTQ
jgi:hypothetical protein